MFTLSLSIIAAEKAQKSGEHTYLAQNTHILRAHRPHLGAPPAFGRAARIWARRPPLPAGRQFKTTFCRLSNFCRARARKSPASAHSSASSASFFASKMTEAG